MGTVCELQIQNRWWFQIAKGYVRVFRNQEKRVSDASVEALGKVAKPIVTWTTITKSSLMRKHHWSKMEENHKKKKQKFSVKDEEISEIVSF